MNNPTPDEFLNAANEGLVDHRPYEWITDPEVLATIPARSRRRRASHELALDLAQLRLAFGLTQTDVAAASGRPQSVISRIERAPEVIQLATLIAYLNGLGAHAKLVIERDDATYDLTLT